MKKQKYINDNNATQSSLYNLPKDVLQNIPTTLEKPLQTMARLAQTNKHMYSLFQPKLSSHKLLQHVMKGEEFEVIELLEQHPELCLIKAQGTDYSGRTFKNISPLQYAAWGYDIQMLRTMYRKFISCGQTDMANKQLIELDDLGTEHGSHYDFAALIDAYNNLYLTTKLNHAVNIQITANKLQLTRHTNKDEIIKAIGSQQRLLPIFLVNLFCLPNNERNLYLQDKNPSIVRTMYFKVSENRSDKWYPLTKNERLGKKYMISMADKRQYNPFIISNNNQYDISNILSSNFDAILQIDKKVKREYESFKDAHIRIAKRRRL